MNTRRQRPVACLALAALSLLASSPAWALYKVVGPDGKVSYTDVPPANANASQVKSVAVGSGASALSAGLPFELAKVVRQYPVTFYAFKGCNICEQGRQYLKQRGVPFQEKSVDTQADMKLYEALNGGRQMPLLVIGRQHVKGYDSQEWSSYLDAAGYPTASQVPAGYAWPAASPLAPAQAEPSDAKASEAKASTAPRRAAPSKSTGNAPPGFRF